MRTEAGDMMREILREYHEYVSLPYWGPAYVKPTLYSAYPDYAFIVTPFRKYVRRQFIVHKQWSTQFWIFEEIPF